MVSIAPKVTQNNDDDLEITQNGFVLECPVMTVKWRVEEYISDVKEQFHPRYSWILMVNWSEKISETLSIFLSFRKGGDIRDTWRRFRSRRVFRMTDFSVKTYFR